MFADYKIVQMLYRGKDTSIYKALRSVDGRTVILKTLMGSDAPPQRFNRLKHEFEIGRKFSNRNVIRYLNFISQRQTTAIVLEDFSAVALSGIIPEKGCDTAQFLNYAMQLTSALHHIHGKTIVHGALSPHHVLVNPYTGDSKLTDFSASFKVGENKQLFRTPVSHSKAFNYISPEQTGRVERPVEYSTDLYSLGIIFYMLLSGQLPFRSHDSMELIHSHLARRPQSLIDRKPDIPVIISDIVMKLLEKDPEDRYQTTLGLKNDLLHCFREHKSTGRISKLIPGCQDVPYRLKLPRTLYGRKMESKELISAFRRVQQGKSEIVLVTGKAGVGKTELINGLQKHVLAEKGYFISGKFDALTQNIAHVGIINAFGGLVRQILCEPEESVVRWREKILSVLDKNAQVIVDVIGDVEKIIGPQPIVTEVGPNEEKNRFKLLFRHFVGAFAELKHPLVLFLDDLHWADSASLDAMTDLLQVPYLLQIGAFRDNEVDSSHTLATTIEAIEDAHVKKSVIQISSLQTPPIHRLISDVLACPLNKARELAEVVRRKTGGNIFFVREFLKSLHKNGVLTLADGGWNWEIRDVIAMEVSENVVDLLADNIRALPSETQEALKLAACIGNDFTLDTLALALETTPAGASDRLGHAFTAGIIARTDESNRFVHDRIHEATYGLTPDRLKPEVHYRIGRLLIEKYGENFSSGKLLKETVKQLNLGRSAAIDPEECILASKLNLKAGKLTRASGAFLTSFSYFSSGLAFLPEDAWDRHYELSFELSLSKAETEFMTGMFKAAEIHLADLLKHAVNRHDKTRVYCLMIRLFTQLHDNVTAIRKLRTGFSLFDVELPKEKGAVKAAILKEQHRLKIMLDEIAVEELLDLPDMTDQDQLSLHKIFMAGAMTLYYTDPDTFALSILKMVNISIRYGNSADAYFFYATYGMLLTTIFHDYDTGYRFGKIALKLNRRLKTDANKSALYMVFSGFISHWKEPIKISIDLAVEGFRSGIETGAFDSALVNATYHIMFSMSKGDLLDDILVKCRRYLDEVSHLAGPLTLLLFQLRKQLILALQGRTKLLESLTDNHFNEEQVFLTLKKRNDPASSFHYYHVKEMLCFLSEYSTKGLWYSIKARENMELRAGQPNGAEHYFYHTLILSSLYVAADKKEKKEYLLNISENLDRMKLWAESCPENYANEHLLVRAEYERIIGNSLKAADFYDQAIESANKNGFVQNEAIACELAAKFHLSHAKESISRLYMARAIQCYDRWGARGKVKQLGERYPLLVPSKSIFDESNGLDDVLANSFSDVDLKTVIKASQAISGEIRLNHLLKQLIRLMMANTGAEKGALVLKSEEGLLIQAVASTDRRDIEVHQKRSVEQYSEISSAIVHFVARTGEDVIIHDAGQDSQFIHDAYVASAHPKSILCTPLRHKDVITGVLYLENRFATNIFSIDRLEVVRVLLAQAAISIENASLYDNLRREVSENKKAHIALLTYQKQLKNMTSQLSSTEERERRRIAQDLHDSVSQNLAMCISRLKNIQASLIDGSIAEQLKTTLTFIEQSIKEVRSLTFELSPPILYDFGLVAALEWLAEDIGNRYGILVSYQGIEREERLDEQVKVILYRATRELLINSVKHGQAKHAQIDVSADNGMIKIRVKDDGSGFPEGLIDSPVLKGFGLFSIRERLEPLGGKVEAVSESDSGALMVLSAPLSRRLGTIKKSTGGF